MFGSISNKNIEVSTEKFKNMSVRELREFTLEYYNTHLKGDKAIIKKHLKEVIFTNRAGKKIARGEAMYSAKASAIEHLKELIENSTYNNWENRKQKDTKDVLGYLNFKSKITIDGQKRHVRIALTVYKDRKTQLKNIEVGNKKPLKSTQEPVATLLNEEIREVFYDKNTKKSVNRKKSAPKNKKKGLNAPNDIPKTSEKHVHSNIRSINDIGHNGSSFLKSMVK